MKPLPHHADVREIWYGLAKIEDALGLIGMKSPWIERAQDMLAKQSIEIAQRRGEIDGGEE